MKEIKVVRMALEAIDEQRGFVIETLLDPQLQEALDLVAEALPALSAIEKLVDELKQALLTLNELMGENN